VSLPITPETKVGALLEAYPGLEEILISCAPAFAKLRNPVLRKTVAKVATLEQAARVGGLGVRELIAKLRAAAGQGEEEPQVENAAEELGPALRPEARIVANLDADEILAAGEHPLGRIRRVAGTLASGETLRLRSSFRPEPLIQMMKESGFEVYSAEVAPGRYETLVGRN
jgi:hypothetical protein